MNIFNKNIKKQCKPEDNKCNNKKIEKDYQPPILSLVKLPLKD